MCDKKILYKASTHPLGKLTKRGRGEKLNFKQICYTTDCLTDYASRREIPISNAVVELKNMGAFPTIYRAARKRAIEPSQNVVSRLIKQGKGV
jgi:hypothetical protein